MTQKEIKDMIIEDYVSFKTAKLLREKGFDDRCFSFYWSDGSLDANSHDKHTNLRNSTSSNPVAPTLQMAMKWLRDNYKLCVVIRPYVTEEGIFYLFEIKETNKDSVVNQKTKTGFDTYEEACEAAIKYCIENLI